MKRLADYRLFFHFLKKYRSYYAIGIGSLIIVDAIEIIPPLLLKWAVDALVEKRATSTLLLEICAAYMAVAAVQALMRFYWRKYIIRTSMFAAHDLRSSFFTHLTKLSTTFFRRNRTGELVSISTNDIESIRFALGPGALTLFDALFYFLTIPPVMFYLSPKLAILALLPLLVLPPFVRYLEGKIRSKFANVQENFGAIASHAQETLSGVRVIKGSGLEPFKERSFDDLGERYIQSNYQLAWYQTLLNSGLDFFVSSAICLVFVVGGAAVIGEELSIGVFVAFQRYIQKLTWPMEAIGLAAGIFQRSLASEHRYQAIMNHKPEEDVVTPAPITNTPSIRFDSLSFAYPGADRYALKEVSLEIAAGTRLGLIGKVGSGKTTLLQLLVRGENAPAGSLFLDNKDINSISLEDVRRSCGLVPQDVFLFSETIARNVLYGTENFAGEDDQLLQDPRLTSALQSAVIEREVRDFPSQHLTILGERGARLSGGQKQRLTIARALALKPRVLLLDDCLSAVDAETELRLIHSIDQLDRSQTLIMSSHRLSIMRFMDWVVELDEGRIIRQGRPRDLGLGSAPDISELLQ